MKYLIITLNLIIGLSAYSQKKYDPVDWEIYYQELGKSKYKITIDGQIQSDWIIPGDQNTSQNGLIFLQIVFDENDNFEFIDTIYETKPKFMYHEFFEEEFFVYSNRLTRSFIVRILDINEPGVLSGWIEFMALTDKIALPPLAICLKYKLNELDVKTIIIGKECIIASKK